MSLPSGFKKLEYIQSSGTQYINTGHSFTSNNGRVIAKLQYTASPDGASAFGSTPTAGTPWSIIMYGTKPDFYVAGSILNMGFGSVSVGTDYTVDCTADNGSFTVVWNDITYQNTYSGTIVGTGTLAIFCHLNGSNAIQQCSMKLYSCQIYDNGTLIRDYIPCQTTSGEIGLWDDANSKFYTNAGTGVFTAGPEVKGTNKTLIDGTAYGVETGKCLISGTAYTLKKGRTLIGGTGYDVKLKTSPTWYLNDSLGYNTLERTNVGFTANGEHFDQIVAFSMMGGVQLIFIVTSPATSVTPYDRGWTQSAYRTVTFDEEPTGALLTWLDANGTRQ